MIALSSFPDIKAPHAINARRIPRKPPPAIDPSERYPSPDPLDPFAPLWVLRNRTQSALQGGTARSPLPPYSDPYGSQDTLNNLAERTPSNPYLDSSPTSSLATHGKSETRAFSPPESPTGLINKSKSKPNSKTSHYIPYSRINAVGTLQAFPRIPNPPAPQTYINLASPESQRPWSPNNRRAQSPQLRTGADFIHSAGSGTDSEADDNASIMSSLKIASPKITHPHLQRHLEPMPIMPDAYPRPTMAYPRPTTAPSLGLSPTSEQTVKSHKRFASFFLPKKTGSLIGVGDGGRAITVSTANGTTGERTRATEFRRVSKSAISAPRAVQSTVIWDSKNNRGRVPITGANNATANTDFNGGAEQEMNLEKRPKNSSKFSRSHLNHLTIRKLTDKHDFYADRHFNLSEPRYSSDGQSRSLDKAKKSRCAPILRSLSVPLPSTFTGNKQQQEQRIGPKSRISSSPSLSPDRPSMRSISNTSIVEVSIATPSFASNPTDEEDGSYTCPRPAPHPPLQGTEAPKIVDVRHSESSCCSSNRDAILPSTRATPRPIPVSDSFPTEWAIPTSPQITEASSLQITGEDGIPVSFGSLFATTRTIVVFIRHFWCPLCQDYMMSLKSIVRPEMLSAWPVGDDKDAQDLKARLVNFVVISNGSYGMIHKYKQMFGLPFKVYTDPELAIYKALGMGRDGGHYERDHNHNHIQQQQQRHYQQKRFEKQVPVIGSPSAGIGLPASQEENTGGKFGGYVKHGLMGGIAMVIVRAIKVGMPVWEKGGDIGQLGGEFIFGPGLTCSFAHRMQNTKGHAPIEDVLAAAGIDVNAGDVSRHDEKQDLRATPAQALSAEGQLAASLQSNPPRKRLSSLKSLKGSLRGRTASLSSRAPIATVSFSAAGAVIADGDQLRRQSRRFSMGMFAGMMSREEEESWMEERQLSIERLREKKDIRRGMMGRAVSAQSYTAQVLNADVTSVDGDSAQEKPRWPSTQESYWEPMSDLEVVGKMDDVEEELDEDLDQTMVRPARRSFESMTDSASTYSTPSAKVMPLNGGTYIFMDRDHKTS